MAPPTMTTSRFIPAFAFVLGVAAITTIFNMIAIPKELPTPVYSAAFLLSPVVSVLAFYSVVRVSLILGLRSPMTMSSLMKETFDEVAWGLAARVVIVVVMGYAILSFSAIQTGGFYALLILLALYGVRVGLDHTYKEALVERGIATTEEIKRETRDQRSLKSKALVAIGYRGGRHRIKAPYLQAAIVYFLPLGILSFISAIFSPESQGGMWVSLVAIMALCGSALLWSWVARRRMEKK